MKARLLRYCGGILALCVAVTLNVRVGLASDDPLDWTTWRGPEQNGVSRETGLVSSWRPGGENELWKNDKISTRSTPIIMNGKLYTICRAEPGTPREGERVVCLDPETGKLLWENRFSVFLSDVPDTRVGWSNVTGDPSTGRIYALGVCGWFQCIDGETGKTIWSKSLKEEYGLLDTYGGRTHTPVIVDDLVIISAVFINWGDSVDPPDPYLAFDERTGGLNAMALPAHRFLAMDKHTGQPIWFNGTRLLPYDTTYDTPLLTVLNGQSAMIFGSGDGAVYAMQPRTGRLIWKYQLARRGLNVSPIIVDGTVYTGQSEENRDDSTMGAVAAINARLTGDVTESGELWRIKEAMCGKVSPLFIDGRIYMGEDTGALSIFDAATGKRLARQRLVGTMLRASPLLADGKIYMATTGAWHVMEPTDNGVKFLDRVRLPRGEEVYGSPIVSHGRIFLPTTAGIYCIGSRGQRPTAARRPKPPRESPVDEDPTPAHVQIVPAELLLRSGEEQRFTVRLYNSRGQFLRESAADFAVERGVGSIDNDGKYIAPRERVHDQAIIAARVGDLVGKARVRVIPELPWHFDFADGNIPITWVASRYRHVVREIDGKPVMVKVSTIPKGTRSQGWFGHPDLHDYTVEADVMGAEQGGKLPEVGIIAQRYALVMKGASQELQIRTWHAQEQYAQTIAFSWKPNVWYTMKLRAGLEDGTVVLKGKVWPKGEAEPQAWALEAVDETSNTQGSPGVWGNATDAEIYYARIDVTPN